MRRFELHPGWIVALVVVAIVCLAAGAGLGRAWEDYLDYSRRRRWAEEARRNPSGRWDAMMRAESIAMARHDSSTHAVKQPPAEFRRTQVGQHCAVSYLFPAPVPEPLLTVQATSITTNDPVGQGYVYHEGGWHPGDTATAVIPYTECRFTAILGFTFGAVTAVPKPAPRLDVR